jgi:two-component system OmpR family sensor kinase
MGRKEIKIDLLIHDFKVPLAVIESGISLLLKKPEKYGLLTEKQEKVLNRTLRNTKVMQMLVDDLLELGRSREGIFKLTSFRVSTLFEETFIELFDLVDSDISERIKTCSGLDELKEILSKNDLILLVDEALWSQEICLDEAKIKQILRNLLSNALKYKRRFIEITVDKKDDHLFFSIQDDGKGILSVYHKKIFESYFYLELKDLGTVKGSGLGLAGVMVLMEDLGGKMFIESEEGKGAKFSVTIPLVKKCGHGSGQPSRSP